MSTRARGRGTSERGAHGNNTRARGTTPRGGFHSNRSSEGNGGATTNASTPRGPRADRGQRGGLSRGVGHFRGSRGAHGGQMNPTSSASTGAISNATPHAQDDYAARLQFLRKERPRLKKLLIDQKLMSPEGQIDIRRAVPIIGICTDMCPEFERVRRIVEKDLKLPEYTPESLRLGDRHARVPDESRMVKAYARPAAGNDADMVTDIRTPAVCLKSTIYMIERLDYEKFEFLHGWLWDRTRAVRKDLNQQRIDKAEDIAIFQTCFELNARLLLMSLHQMARSTNEDYSHRQDMEQLFATLLSLKYRYEDNRRDRVVSPNEAEIQAYRLILAARGNDRTVEHDVQSDRHIRDNRRVQTALEILRAGRTILGRQIVPYTVAQQNWKNFWDLIASSRVSYLMACAAEIHFNQFRHTILDAIYRIYRQKAVVEDLKLSFLLEVLGFDTKDETRKFCELYGFSFAASKDGDLYLDMECGPFLYRDDIKRLDQPPNLKEQTFSRKLVESKRKNRLLSAVIQGMSVFEAFSRGFVVEESHLTEQIGTEEDPVEGNSDEEDSLFVRDDSTTKPTGFATVGGLSGLSSGQSAESSSQPNPFANPSQPNGITTGQSTASSTAPNPFLSNGTATALRTQGSPFTGLGGSSPFNTNGSVPFSFGRPSVAPNASSSASPGTLSTERSIFTTSPATGQTVQPGLFDVNKNAIRFSPGSSFGSPSRTPPSTATPNKPVEPVTTSGSSPFSAFNTAAAERKPNGLTTSSPPPTGLLTSGSICPPSGQPSTSPFKTEQPPSADYINEPSKQAPFTSSSATLLQPSSERLGSQQTSAEQAEKERKDQEAKRRAEQEQERRKREEQERRVQEEEARKAKEREQKAREARERQLQEKARIARQEQEQRERQQKAEQDRKEALQRQKEINIENLTRNVFLDPTEGLLAQFIEQKVRTLAWTCAEELKQEQAEQLAREHRERKQMERIRAYCQRWYTVVVKKKKMRRARNRRQWLKDNAHELMATQAGSITDPVITAQVSVQRNGFKKPDVPASVSANRIEKRPLSARAQARQPFVKAVEGVAKAKRRPQSWQASASATNGTTSTSFGLKKSNVPIDRTETDYFKLRALGIDPTKHRKRSLDSQTEAEEDIENDRKRARTSVSSASRTSPSSNPAPVPQQPSIKEDDLLSRYHAFKATLKKSVPVSTPTRPEWQHHGHKSPRDLDAVIANARVMLSKDRTSSKNSSTDIQHEFSRSVPDLTSQPYNISRASFGKSAGKQATQAKPAYWGRVSRFVPRALYGKGAGALRDYWSQSRGTSSTTSSVRNDEPLNLGSPIPIPHSDGPTDITIDLAYSEVDGYAEEEDEIMTDEDQIVGDEDEIMSDEGDDEIEGISSEEEGDEAGVEDEEEEEEEEEIYDEEEYDDEEDGYGYGKQYNQNAPAFSGPGATQDDAIELSD